MLESNNLAKACSKPTSSRLVIEDVHINSVAVAERCTEGGTSDKLPKAKMPLKKMPLMGACATLKLNKARFYKKNRDMQPKAYVADQVKSLDNTLLDYAVGKLFADTDRKMKPYKKADLD